MFRFQCAASALFGAVLVACLGCESGPHLNDLSGTVKYQGQPVPDVILNFIPADGRPGQAITDQNGHFQQIMFDRERYGLLTGEYQVVLTWLPSDPAAEPAANPTAPPPPPPVALQPLLKKYGDFTNPQMRVTIVNGQKQLELNLD